MLPIDRPTDPGRAFNENQITDNRPNPMNRLISNDAARPAMRPTPEMINDFNSKQGNMSLTRMGPDGQIAY